MSKTLEQTKQDIWQWFINYKYYGCHVFQHPKTKKFLILASEKEWAFKYFLRNYKDRIPFADQPDESWKNAICLGHPTSYPEALELIENF